MSRSTAVRGSILVADDEERFAQAIARRLRNEGFECTAVADGQSAAEQLRTGRFDLLIADTGLPGNAKLELARRQPEITDLINVILLAGQPSGATAKPVVSLPVSAHLVKPVEFDELLAHVEQAIRGPRVHLTVESTLPQPECWTRHSRCSAPPPDNSAGSLSSDIESEMASALSSMLGGLLDAQNVSRFATISADASRTRRPCAGAHIRNDADPALLLLREVACVLGRAKRTFESEELDELSRRVEGFLDRQARDSRRQDAAKQ